MTFQNDSVTDYVTNRDKLMPALKNISFVKQTTRFAGALSGLMRDIFSFDRKLVSKQVFFAILGPTIQAAALGLVLFLARDFGADGNFESIVLKPLGGIVVDTSIALTFILLLLCLSIFLLYEAERLIAYISSQYANKRAAEFIIYYPLISHRYNPVFFDNDQLVSADLVNKVKEHAGILFIAARIILRLPTAVLYTIYGSAFLLYLEPLLTLILVVFTLPLLIPLRHFTRDITYHEREKSRIGSQTRSDLSSIISDARNIADMSTDLVNQILDRCSQSALAETNKMNMMRRVNIARSKAIANTALAIAVGISAFYFFVFSDPSDLSITNIVVFFISLRLASMGGKKATSSIARFAMFYNRAHSYLFEREYAGSRNFRPDSNLVVSAMNLEYSTYDEKIITPGKPLAIIGSGKISVINKNKVAVFEDKTGSMDRGDIISGIYLIPEDPVIQTNTTWREFLWLSKEYEYDEFINKAESVCYEIDIRSLCHKLDDPVSINVSDSTFTLSQRVELLLLRFYFSNNPIIVLSASLVSKLDSDLIKSWITILHKRIICIYYIFDSASPFYCLGETGVLINSAGNVIGMASTDYFKNNPERIVELINREEPTTTNPDGLSLDLFDNDDDEL